MDTEITKGLINLFSDKTYIHTKKTNNCISFSVYYTESPHLYTSQYNNKKILYTRHVYFHRDGSYEYMDTIQGRHVTLLDKIRKKITRDMDINGFIVTQDERGLKNIRWNNKELKKEIDSYMKSTGRRERVLI